MMAAVQSSSIRLADLVRGLVARPYGGDCTLTGLAIDSRQVRPGDCFLAYAGTREDGARYIRAAAAAGAVAVLTEAADVLPAPGIPVLGITGLREHLPTLARRFYGDPAQHMRLIAITGTKGKTTTAHLCAQALRTIYGRSGYFGTLGYGALDALESGPNTTPDPVTFQRVLSSLAAEGCGHVALEASSHALDQGRLAQLPVAVAVFTGLGHDHLDYHGSLAAYGEAKQSLFRLPGLQAAVVNADDPYAQQMLAALAPGTPAYTFSLRADGAPAAVQALAVRCTREGSEVDLRTWQGEFSLRSPLLGEFNVQNLLAALTALMAAGTPAATAVAALAKAHPVRGRMELITGTSNQPLVCVDYAHTPDSLERVLRALRLPGVARLICVFGCGGDRDRSKRGPMGGIAERDADRVIVTADNPRSEDPATIADEICAGMREPARTLVVLDRAAAIRTALMEAGPADVVLIAGKGHESTQTGGGAVVAFDDVAVARALLQELANA